MSSTSDQIDGTNQNKDAGNGKVESSCEVEVKKRDSWGNKAEFILASIGLSVGLGNVWRFPYLVQKNGGGAFLIPYCIMMIIEGIPLFYIELAIGQRFKRTSVGCFAKLHPALKGIGISCIVISMLLCVYYIAVIAWCFYYMFSSFTAKLPWALASCPQYEKYNILKTQCESNRTLYNTTICVNVTQFPDCCVHDPQLYYFYRKALNVSPSIDDLGSGVNWKLVGCLVLSWLVVYGSIVKGVKSSGKVVYFTATFPYVVLFILFFLGITLEGAAGGLKVLFYPDFSRLSSPEIWMDAAAQIFFSLGVGFGALISFSSYMPIKNNCVRDTYTVVLTDFATSIFAAIVVFSILGHREHVLGKPSNEIGGGPGLAFITFCDAFLLMPASQVWSFLFFMMLILLGIDSEFGTLEGAIAPFYDMNWIKMKKEYFTGLVVVVMMVIGIALCSSSGFYAFQIFDDHSVSLGLLFIIFFQTVAVSWVYGTDKFANDIEYMTGKRPYLFWMICWKYLSPLAILVIFISNTITLIKDSATYKVFVGCTQQLVDFSPLGKGTEKSTLSVVYPGWAQVIVFVFIVLPMTPTIVYLIRDLVKSPSAWVKGFKEKLGTLSNYHPDPYRVDSKRRKSPEEMEIEIKTEHVEDQY